MNDEMCLEIIDKIFLNVFNEKNPFSIDRTFEVFAFDMKLPKKVYDSTTGEETWADSINPTQFITMKNAEKIDIDRGWMLETEEINSLEELLNTWKKVNYTTTERVFDSIDVVKSDTVYRSEKVYQSTNCGDSKNLVFCDGCYDSEFVLASSRSTNCSFCIRVDDSANCSNSYNVVCSGKISNSLFIQDCNNMHECMFCSHLANKKYCISNMQFEREKYFEIKRAIISWILNS